MAKAKRRCIELLSKLHSIVKIAVFGIFFPKFYRVGGGITLRPLTPPYVRVSYTAVRLVMGSVHHTFPTWIHTLVSSAVPA